jgi:hypothetical protein
MSRGTRRSGRIVVYRETDQRPTGLRAGADKCILMLRLYGPRETPHSFIDGSANISPEKEVKGNVKQIG